MRLKQLELQGYKTFATKTQFMFNGGLTAIIGPNGSGKSNVADAIQWVLGEQNYGLLRAKRSEDMIFSGSNERARMGMAQASLTLDNSDGWLPIDYGEVVVARRTYRSGENEYYLNGSRVRLRDITDLLAQSGLSKRTYTVIGQGLIDQALSLRPDERRALIEEAAGITGHQNKRNRALRQLDETKRNLERVRDIMQEIEPRLRYLKGQARRAEERRQVQADLDSHLRVWYGYRWHRGLHELNKAREQEAATRRIVEARRETLQRLEQADEQLRQRYAEVRNQLGDWHRESSVLHRQAETTQRELAVGSERLRQLGERREDLLRELAPLQERRDAQQGQVRASEGALAGERHELQGIERQVAELQSQADAAEVERNQFQRALSQAERQMAQLQHEIANQERHLLEQEARRRTLAEESERLQGELAGAEANQERLQPQIAAQQDRLGAIQRESRAMTERRQALREAMAQAEADIAQNAERLATQRRAADRLQDQLEMLQRLKEEGEGYSGGTRAIVRAVGSKNADLQGIIGTVGDQLRVPAELELAIETALGGRLQDLIVERWHDAEAAIDWLKGTRSGRATFLPLDTLRSSGRLRPPRGEGVIGLAADLVEADASLSKVVDYLLGRVVVTKDLSTARRILDATSERPTVVTVEGDIVRPGGSVSGGSQQRRQDQGVLARERGLRELPRQVEQAHQQVAELEKAQALLQEQVRTNRTERARLDHGLGELAKAQQEESSSLAKLQGQATQMAQELRWRQERLAAVDDEQESLAQRAQQYQRRLAELSEQLQASHQAASEAEAALADMDTRELAAGLMELRSTASVVETRVSSQEALLANQQRALNQVQQEIRNKEQRAQELAAGIDALNTRMQELRQEDGRLKAEIEAYAAKIEPGEAELASLEAERNQLVHEETEHRRQLQREEQAHHQAHLGLQHAGDELTHLRHEIEHDVGLVELEQSDSVDDQPPLPLRPLVERLPVVDALPEGTRQEIRRLRSQFSRLGGVNPNAPEEYASTLERYDFLSSQASDLEEAAESLNRVINELDEVMHREFMATFRAIAREFRDKFTTLFGGGTARLELSDPENPMESGIEIVVRPPGRRTQPLPLLSGGERSLTAAALILSILTVSPPPFCILDEVDAALDEANVDRFRAALREAARDLQFIVITHNRGTIEVADTIYGISMGSDSSSQALSLQLEERGGQRELVPA